jgi:Zn-dependent protease
MAVKCGDPTPKLYKRYTINPLAHFDWIGLACFVFAGFGWAKPVPVNPANFKNYKRGSFLVAIAGVLMNYLVAFLVVPLFMLVTLYVPNFGYFTIVLRESLRLIYQYCLVFFIFNLIPVYPLDGFRVIDVFSKKRSQIYWFLRTKGIFVLYGLIGLSILSDFTGIQAFNIFGIFMNKATNVIGYPILAFWGLFF